MEKSSISTEIKIIIKNFFHLAFGELASKAFGFFTTIYIARSVGIERFGELSFLAVVYSYFSLFANPSLDMIAVRELAKGEYEENSIVSTMFILRFVLSLASAIIFLIIGITVFNSQLPLMIVLFQAINFFLIPLSLEFYFRGKEDMKWIAVMKTLSSVILLLLTLIVITSQDDYIFLPLLYAVSTLAGTMLLFVKGFRKHSKFSFTFHFPLCKWMLQESLPLGISSFAVLIYYNIDTVFIWKFLNPAEVGLYTAAYKIFFVFSILNVFMSALLPSLSKAWRERKDDFYAQLFTVSKYVYVVAAFLVALSFYSRYIIENIFGHEYLDAQLVLRILLITQAVIWFFAPFGHPLIAMNRQNILLKVSLFGATINVCLNLIFIPALGINGAALATLATEITVGILLFGYFYSKRNVLSFKLKFIPKESIVFLLCNIIFGELFSIIIQYSLLSIISIIVVNIVLMKYYKYFNIYQYA